MVNAGKVVKKFILMVVIINSLIFVLLDNVPDTKLSVSTIDAQ